MNVARTNGKLRRSDFRWFDLSRYEAFTDFKPYEWAFALKNRRHLRELMQFQPADGGWALPGDAADYADYAEMFQRSPSTLVEFEIMWTLESPAGPRSPTDPGYPAPVPEQGKSVIADVTVRDFYTQYADLQGANCLDDEGVTFARRWLRGQGRSWSRVTEGEKLRQAVQRAKYGDAAGEDGVYEEVFEQTVAQFMQGEGRSPYEQPDYERWVSVDLCASDERILADMADWLALRRGELRGQTPKGTPASMASKWILHGVMPYVDLQLFAVLTGRSLPDALAGDLIFPEGEFDRAEKIRKTVRGLADDLMAPSFTAALAKQEVWS